MPVSWASAVSSRSNLAHATSSKAGAIRPFFASANLQWLAKVRDRKTYADKQDAPPDAPPSVAPDAILAQLLAMDAGTGLLAKLGLKIERTTTSVSVVGQVETKPAALPGDKKE